MLRILAIIAPSIAASMSASSNTMNGALPPSSIAGFRILSAASCSSLRPTSVEPVNDTTRTRGSCSIALTTGPERRDGITFTTPAGTPASSSSGISASMVSGVSLAGLSTTGQPAASAGPILRVAIAAGKFHGVTSTATPAGLCCATTRAPDAGVLVLGRGIDHVETRAVGCLAPFAADPQIGRHVGEQVVVHGHDIDPQIHPLSFRGRAKRGARNP